VKLLLILLVTLVGCGGGGTTAECSCLPPEPEEAPDVVLLTVSGRNLDVLDFFCPPECNEAYLGNVGDAGEAIYTELTAGGLTVDTEHYIAAWESYANPDRLGCRQLIEDLRWIDENWPTARIVLVGHSHGCVWAHNVVAALPAIQIEVLVSIDGVSLYWETDHADSINDWYTSVGGNPFAHDLSDVTDRWVTAAGDRDTKDVAFDQVSFNIEIQSGDTLISDSVDNVRIDGSFTDIARFAANDSHSEVHQPNTASMNFILDQLSTWLLAP
jgi:pimeloyl-ACP methyl ester carboxylesterase